MKTLMGVSLFFGLLAAVPPATADERPPKDAKPLLEVVTGLEKKGYGPIIEIGFDDGVWEAEVYKDETALELSIDPATGEVVAEHRDDGDRKPPAESMMLSEIIGALEEAGFADLNDISFEGQNWEVEATRDNQKRELRVDPKSGKVISDRVDD